MDVGSSPTSSNILIPLVIFYIIIYFIYSIFNYYLYLILMILSNFILFLIYQKKQCTNFFLRQRNQITYNLILKTNHISDNQVLFTSSNQNIQKNLEIFNPSDLSNKLVSRNLWQKLINQYLQETIILSPSNKFAVSYIAKLKTMGLSVYNSNQYKSFLYKLSKDLINGKININSKNRNDLIVYGLDYRENLHIKYTWLKLFSFKFLNFVNFKQNIFHSFQNYKLPLINNSLPLFILINNNSEIVMSESVEEIYKFTNSINIWRNFTNKFYNINVNKHKYTCLLFVNYNDALEYKNYINYQNTNSTRKLGIEIVPSNINFYNRLNKSSNNQIDFRLIPDLKEISNLVNIYGKYRNVSFKMNQNYGSSFFQGQPLYQIESFNLKNKGDQIISNKNLYFLKKNNKYTNFNTFFLNYNTALSAWKQLVKENSDFQLPNKPPILVSNLESFIKDKQHTKFFTNLIFLPSLENYFFIKQYVQCSLKDQSTLQYWLSNQSTYLKTLCYRIFWSLTTRHPSNW